MSGGEKYIADNLLRRDEIQMPRHLTPELYKELPAELRQIASFGIAEWAYNAIVEAYWKGRG